MFRPDFLFPSLGHGGECFIHLRGTRWQSLYTVCVHPWKIMEADGLKAIVENSPLMFWHVAKILLSSSASFHAGQSVPAAA